MERPVVIRDVAHLEELLSEPSDAAIEAVRRANGDVLVLGVAGKMGPTLARMARRAMDAAGLSPPGHRGLTLFLAAPAAGARSLRRRDDPL